MASRWRVGVGLIGAILAVVGMGGCGSADDPWKDAKGVRVMASFPPLYCFAANVGGEHVTVLPLVEGVGIHDYQPSPRDAIKLNKANLFLLNGLDLDNAFAQKLLTNTKNPSLRIVEVGKCIPADQLLRMDAHDEHAHASGHEHHHHHGEYDPHVWLGLPEAMRMVDCIRDRLKEADAAHARVYDENAAQYRTKLQNLLLAGQKQLADKKERKIISFHDSLRYFARSLGLEVLDSIQPLPGEDPSPAHQAELVKLCQKEKVRVIAVEPNQLTNRAAQALLKELKNKGVADAEIVELDILENVSTDDLKPDYYAEKMQTNIAKLAKALR